MRRVRIALLVVVALAVVVTVGLMRRGPPVPDGAALTVPLEGAYVEAADAGMFARLSSLFVAPPPSFPALLSQLGKAERDPRIGAVVLRVRSLDVGWGKAQELRGAIARLRDAGKETVAYLETQSYGSNLEYYVAAACDEVVLAPGVPAPLSGLRAEYLFLGGFWESLGVEFDVLGVGEYKSAVETLSARGMSGPHREMANALLDSLESQFVADVAASRSLTLEAVRAALDASPFLPAGAVERKLVDRIDHWDEIFAQRGAPPEVELATYGAVPASAVGFEPVARFALIFGAGNVVQGEAAGPRTVFASDTVVQALEEAARDDAVRAIVLRLDSPGGSGPAAEQVWRAVRRARVHKPVVVSMSDMAASAAYYVAAASDHVVAHRGTYTGSIGVFLIRPSIGGLLDKLDIGHEALLRGEHADLLAVTRPLSKATRTRFLSDIQGAYVQFVERVAEGRELSEAQVDAVARGRVWTGEQARSRGLVDELGGLREAVRAAKRLVDLEPDADVELEVRPGPRSLGEQLRKAAGMARATLAPALPGADRRWQGPLATAAAWLADLPLGTPAWLPPIAIEIR